MLFNGKPTVRIQIKFVEISVIREINADKFELPESHGAHDLSQVVSREELLLLCVEQVEADFQALDLVIGQAGQLVDLLEVNVAVRVRLACHAGVECLGCGQILLDRCAGERQFPSPIFDLFKKCTAVFQHCYCCFLNWPCWT